MLHKFISIFRKNEPRKQQLKAILSVAIDIAKNNPDALRDFVRLLGRKLQSDYMCRAVSSLDREKDSSLQPRLAWFDEFHPLNPRGERLFDLKRDIKTNRILNLSSDIVLPWPWHRDRVVSCLSDIGRGRPAGKWAQDTRNHTVEYWLPFGIGWVKRGNHSIMSGIVQSEGTIETDRVYDLSGLFPHVRFDGDAFIRESDGTTIQKVKWVEFAAIFEVGRLMQEQGVSA